MKILLKNANIYGGQTEDILIEDGIIAGIGSFEIWAWEMTETTTPLRNSSHIGIPSRCRSALTA